MNTLPQSHLSGPYICVHLIGLSVSAESLRVSASYSEANSQLCVGSMVLLDSWQSQADVCAERLRGGRHTKSCHVNNVAVSSFFPLKRTHFLCVLMENYLFSSETTFSNWERWDNSGLGRKRNTEEPSILCSFIPVPQKRLLSTLGEQYPHSSQNLSSV